MRRLDEQRFPALVQRILQRFAKDVAELGLDANVWRQPARDALLAFTRRREHRIGSELFAAGALLSGADVDERVESLAAKVELFELAFHLREVLDDPAPTPLVQALLCGVTHQTGEATAARRAVDLMSTRLLLHSLRQLLEEENAAHCISPLLRASCDGVRGKLENGLGNVATWPVSAGDSAYGLGGPWLSRFLVGLRLGASNPLAGRAMRWAQHLAFAHDVTRDLQLMSGVSDGARVDSHVALLRGAAPLALSMLLERLSEEERAQLSEWLERGHIEFAERQELDRMMRVHDVVEVVRRCALSALMRAAKLSSAFKVSVRHALRAIERNALDELAESAKLYSGFSPMSARRRVMESCVIPQSQQGILPKEHDMMQALPYSGAALGAELFAIGGRAPR